MPQKSGVQEALPSTVYCVRVTPLPPPPKPTPDDEVPPLPPPEWVRVTLGDRPIVGNSPAWVSRTSAVAAR